MFSENFLSEEIVNKSLELANDNAAENTEKQKPTEEDEKPASFRRSEHKIKPKNNKKLVSEVPKEIARYTNSPQSNKVTPSTDSLSTEDKQITEQDKLDYDEARALLILIKHVKNLHVRVITDKEISDNKKLGVLPRDIDKMKRKQQVLLYQLENYPKNFKELWQDKGVQDKAKELFDLKEEDFENGMPIDLMKAKIYKTKEMIEKVTSTEEKLYDKIAIIDQKYEVDDSKEIADPNKKKVSFGTAYTHKEPFQVVTYETVQTSLGKMLVKYELAITKKKERTTGAKLKYEGERPEKINMTKKDSEKFNQICKDFEILNQTYNIGSKDEDRYLNDIKKTITQLIEVIKNAL